MAGRIHSVLFDKHKWTTEGARIWLQQHGHKRIKRVDITKNMLRYRLIDPAEFSRFITKKIGDDIELVIGFA